MTAADFYEDDEPVEKIADAFGDGPFQVTSPNASALTFTTATTANLAVVYPAPRIVL